MPHRSTASHTGRRPVTPVDAQTTTLTRAAGDPHTVTESLVIGGTRFIGRHLVEELRAHGHQVTICNRGNHDNPFADADGVDHVETDRTERRDLEAAKLAVEPDYVFDMVAYHPEDVAVATEVFADVDGYVYVSSGASYAGEEIPKRERMTELRGVLPSRRRTTAGRRTATARPRATGSSRARPRTASRRVRSGRVSSTGHTTTRSGWTTGSSAS